MTIVVVGLNHRTAPVVLREKLTLSADALQHALEDIGNYLAPRAGEQRFPALQEAVILSTCNRLEVYVSAERSIDAIKLIEEFLSKRQPGGVTDFRSYLYHYIGDDAIRHLMNVACSLDSMILGETQILGQVAQAFEDSRNAGTTGPILSRLFAKALHTGKRAQTETSIGRYTTSISHAAAHLVLDSLSLSRDVKIVLIGAGEMATLAAQALKRLGVGELKFVNRTFSRAEMLAVRYGGQALPWHDLTKALAWADAAICATGAPSPVLYRHIVEEGLSQRIDRPLVLMDIAVPRDAEESVKAIANVNYFDIDDLQIVVDENIALRQAAVPQVEAIIGQEIDGFLEWHRGRQVTPVIKDLRAWAQSIAEDELLQTLSRLSDADERTHQIVSHMVHRLVNRLMHEPTTRLRLQAHEGNGHRYAHAVRSLFALEGVDPLECSGDPVICATGPADFPAGPCDLRCIMQSSAGQQS